MSFDLRHVARFPPIGKRISELGGITTIVLYEISFCFYMTVCRGRRTKGMNDAVFTTLINSKMCIFVSFLILE